MSAGLPLQKSFRKKKGCTYLGSVRLNGGLRYFAMFHTHVLDYTPSPTCSQLNTALAMTKFN